MKTRRTAHRTDDDATHHRLGQMHSLIAPFAMHEGTAAVRFET